MPDPVQTLKGGDIVHVEPHYGEPYKGTVSATMTAGGSWGYPQHVRVERDGEVADWLPSDRCSRVLAEDGNGNVQILRANGDDDVVPA